MKIDQVMKYCSIMNVYSVWKDDSKVNEKPTGHGGIGNFRKKRCFRNF